MGFEDAVAGAPGYVVSKLTGEVRVIGWGQYRMLEEDLELFNDLSKILMSSGNQSLDQTRLRAVTGFSPTILLDLRNKYKDLDMDHEHNRITVIQEIQNAVKAQLPSRR